ncbi:MAG: GGDEF domain-containing protein [Rhizobiales bacterium]|nr:GGDEF domain-containing protein [Hyphomicrobiales bacterium]
MMHATTAPQGRSQDMLTMIVTTMRQLGVTGLPRNYEIFYEALTGSNQALALDLVSLSKRPTQSELDELSLKYFGQNHGQTVVEQARAAIAHELEDIARILRTERTSLERYSEILSETSSGLANPRLVTREILEKIATVMSVATETTIDNGRQLAETLGEKSQELENVKSKLEEYKKLADTDGLTQLCNRRAFDKALARIYEDPKKVMFGSLILADIDHFKDINDRHGHPTGDKIIQAIASILQHATRGNTFVARTGGEEFAVIIDAANPEAVAGIAERLRAAVAQTPFGNAQTGAGFGPITISLGTCMASDASSAEDLYSKADSALYKSKVGGRNRVTHYSSQPEPVSGGSKGWMLYKTE